LVFFLQFLLPEKVISHDLGDLFEVLEHSQPGAFLTLNTVGVKLTSRVDKVTLAKLRDDVK
jgi:hypothetical protein